VAEGKGNAIPILDLDLFVVWAAAETEDRTDPNRFVQGPTWSMVGAFSLMAWTEILV